MKLYIVLKHQMNSLYLSERYRIQNKSEYLDYLFDYGLEANCHSDDRLATICFTLRDEHLEDLRYPYFRLQCIGQ
jgi:hypothetical protein